jgi:hypothetical protein
VKQHPGGVAGSTLVEGDAAAQRLGLRRAEI